MNASPSSSTATTSASVYSTSTAAHYSPSLQQDNRCHTNNYIINYNNNNNNINNNNNNIINNSNIISSLRLSISPTTSDLDSRLRPANVENNQLQFLTKVIKEAYLMKSAQPLRQPVDHIALQIPDYPQIILRPMDLGTVKTRLLEKYYYSVHECLCDLNQIFTNCYIYNRPWDLVVKMTLQVEKFICNKLKLMPSQELPPLILSSSSTSHNTSKKRPHTKKKGANEPLAKVLHTDNNTTTDTVSTTATVATTAKELPEALNLCLEVLRQLKQRRSLAMSLPFLEPVDTIKLGLTDYNDVIKHPMDMKTMTQKILSHQYNDHQQFNADFHLMIENCITYNGATSAIGKKAESLLRLYRDLYKRLVLDFVNKSTAAVLPPPPPPSSSILKKTTTPFDSSFVTSSPPSPQPPSLVNKVSFSSSLLPSRNVPLPPPPSSSSLSISPAPPPTSVPSHSYINSNQYTADINKNKVTSSSSIVLGTTGSGDSGVGGTSLKSNVKIEPTSSLTMEELHDLQGLFSDCRVLSEKALKLANLLENIKFRIQTFCDRRHTTFAGLQKFLQSRGFDHLPDFFMRPSTDFMGLSGPARAHPVSSSCTTTTPPPLPPHPPLDNDITTTTNTTNTSSPSSSSSQLPIQSKNKTKWKDSPTKSSSSNNNNSAELRSSENSSLSFDEMHELTMIIKRLPQSPLSRIVQLVRTLEKSNTAALLATSSATTTDLLSTSAAAAAPVDIEKGGENSDLKEIEIDLGSLQPHTQHALRRFIHEHFSDEMKKKMQLNNHEKRTRTTTTTPTVENDDDGMRRRTTRRRKRRPRASETTNVVVRNDFEKSESSFDSDDEDDKEEDEDDDSQGANSSSLVNSDRIET